MLTLKSHKNTFFIILTSCVVVSCVPKATEKKALCAGGQAFSSVSRSCYSIAEIRNSPVGTKATDTLSEEVAKTLTLTYNDANKDLAESCKVVVTSAGNIEALSPILMNGDLFSRGDEVSVAATDLASSMSGAASALKSAMDTGYTKAKDTFVYSTVITEMGTFNNAAKSISTLAGSGVHLGNSTTQYYKTLLDGRLNALKPLLDSLTNRCACSGGSCTTTIVPKMGKSGVAGFYYTVTDKDGEGAPKAVSLNVTPMSGLTSHLAPAAQSVYYSVNESATSLASSYSITLPGASDLYLTTPANYRYYFNGSSTGITAHGVVSGCMNLAGSSGLNDLTCTYTPTSGNAYDITTPTKASASFQNLTFTAKAEGVAGNSITIQFIDLQNNNLASDPYVTEVQKFGMVNSISESFVRVAGNNIKVFINPGFTTLAQVEALLVSNPQVSRMVDVLRTGSAAPVGMGSPQSLSGGVNGYDVFTYYANNLITNSTNTASVTIKINAVDDAPTVLSTPLVITPAILEDESGIVNIILPFSDVDYLQGDPVSCSVDFTTLPNIGLAARPMATCTCSGNPTVCSMDVVPTPNFFGAAQFSYTVTTKDQFSVTTQTTGSRVVNMTVTPVNDAPTLSIVSGHKIVAGTATVAANVVSVPYTLTMPENSTIASSGYLCLAVTSGDVVYEASQVLTITAAQLPPNDMTITFGAVKAPPPTTGNVCAAGQYMLPFTNALNKSAMTPTHIVLTVSDGASVNGTNLVSGLGAPTGSPGAGNIYYWDSVGEDCYRSIDASTWSGIIGTPYDTEANCRTSIDLVVTSVDDPPVFTGTSFAIVETNEGGIVQTDGFTVDEDAVNSIDENSQGLSITVASDNHAVLPLNGIKLFYDLNDNGVEDTGEARGNLSGAPGTGDQLESSIGNDAKLHKFYLKLDPIDGVSGNANVTVTVSDGTSTANKSFSLIVNSIAALHGGWKNLSAVGIKTDKNGDPVSEADMVCNYNLKTDAKGCTALVNGVTTPVNCLGAMPPHGSITATDDNVLYYDSGNKRCYRSTSTGWNEIKTMCPITRLSLSDPNSICSGNNCMGSTTPAIAGIIPKAKEQYYFDTSAKTCYVSKDENSDGFDDTNDWEVYLPSKITLTWDSFILTSSGANSGAGIAGWNVYRREAGTDYDLKGGHLKNSSSTSVMTIKTPETMTFTDTTAIAGKIYYYTVRPVDSRRNLPTYTPEIFSEVRMLSPPANYSFVHRWMVNQEICNGMNMTTKTDAPYRVDPLHNYRCPYTGPGESVTSPGYYDIGKDMLVDLQEMGCPYSPAPACGPNGCIGLGDPSSISGNSGEVYYDRSSGTCYAHDGNNWEETKDATTQLAGLTDSMRTALNAPLVNITASKASDICAMRTAPSMAWPQAPLSNAVLPEKKEYMAYSSHRIELDDSAISDIEQGFSLDGNSGCNGRSANGLSTAYTDSAIPTTSHIYSIPGTDSSGIRSLYTGSIPWVNNKSTESCVSRYGIQDLYGNVREWVRDTMLCHDGSTPGLEFTCASQPGTSLYYDMDISGSFHYYGFDPDVGPHNSVGYLTSWEFHEGLFDANKFSFPLALPINVNIDEALIGTAAFESIMDIGSGMSTNKFHGDGLVINSSTIVNGGASGLASMAVGGSYLSGNKAGRYTMELAPVTSASPETGFRCLIPIEADKYPADTGRHTYSY